MGASLLDDVLAETLDPAYAQAAAHRAGQPPPARGRGRLLVALTMVVAGLLVAVTYDQAAATAQGRAPVREALIEDIQSSSATADELTAELERVRAEVARTSDDLLAASGTGQRALEAQHEAERGAAAVPVTGPGLLVTLANAESDAGDDPVGGGSGDTDPRGKVRDGDLQLVVNALWAAGAEAISINDQRLGPTTAIRFAGEAVLVDFRPVMNPYLIRAIGDPDTLSSRFLASPEVNALAVISETFDLRFEFAQEDELTLPAASTPELRSAGPLDDGGG
jgi:uncharacterized protein YlxW (UPF0749 family)